MSSLYILYITDDLFTPCLELIRSICEPTSRSKPHITVRGPVDRLRIDTNIPWKEDPPEIHIIGLASFFNEPKSRHLQNTIYLKCNFFKELFGIYYKPDYYPNVPHITVYDGQSREFANKLFQHISQHSWNFKFRPSSIQLKEKRLGTSKIKPEARSYSQNLIDLFKEITDKNLDYNYIVNLDDDEKLLLVEKIIIYLESHFQPKNITSNSDLETKQKQLQFQMQLFEKYHGGSEDQDLDKKRQQLGQFGTPPELAKEIVKVIRNLLPETNASIDFGDPAIGSGTFIYTINEIIGPEFINSAIGVEIDDDVALLTKERLSEMSKVKIINDDFFKVKLSPKRNLIISNPPYVRYQLIGKEQISKLIKRVQSELGIHASGYSSLYIYFILLSHNWMKKEAIAAWLIPSEFLEVGYGASVRKYLTEKVSLLRIHRYDPTDIQFERVLVTSIVVIFRNREPDLSDKTRITLGGTLDQPEQEIFVTNQTLRNKDKWTLPVLMQTETETPFLKLDDIFNIKRGIATGANSFFILKREEAIQIGIPDSCLRPILPNPQQLTRINTNGIITRDKDGYPILSPQLSVIDCELDETEIKRKYPSFWAYLDSAREKELLNRNLIRRRKPWYKQEKREPPIFLCTYMGRKIKNEGPFKFILNMSDAIATNQYLLLYPKENLSKLIIKNPELIFKIHELLNKLTKQSLINGGRVYGGGLYKMEPGELKKIDATIFNELIELQS